MSTPERAGWYDDPEDDSRLRYFDGIIWSDRTVPKQTRSAQPPPSTEPVAPSGGPGTDVFGRPTSASGQTHQAPVHPSAHVSAPGQQSGHQQGQPGWGMPPQHQQAAWGQQVTAEPTTEDGQTLAGYGARAGAYIIDVLIVGVLNLLLTGWAWWLWMADYWSFAWDAGMSGDPDAVNDLSPEELLGFFDWQYFAIAVGLSLLLQAAYHIGFLATRSATPGKMLLGLSVRRADRAGRLSVGTAFMRMLLPLSVGVCSMIPLLSYLVWLVAVVDLLWPLKDPRRQALHDKIAGTQVVRGKQPREISRES